ncbi:MAG: hypothetical protein ACTXOO_01820 [Sodalis sp. (in: enterobacteria)]
MLLAPIQTYNAMRERRQHCLPIWVRPPLAQTLNKAEQDWQILKSERLYLQTLFGQIDGVALSAQLLTRQPISRHDPRAD